MSTCLIVLNQGRYSPLEKFAKQGVQPTSMLKNYTSSSRIKFSSEESDPTLIPSCGNLINTKTSTNNTKKFNH